MGFRDYFMGQLIKAREKEKAKYPEEASSGKLEPFLPMAARLSLLLDGIKLIGSGNGAGALASVVALYYFKDRNELHAPLKIAAIIFLSGVLLFAITTLAYMSGLTGAAEFAEKYGAKEPKDVPVHGLNRGADAVIALNIAVLAGFASLVCFFVGTVIGLYAVATY
jgi:hypothetical protein